MDEIASDAEFLTTILLTVKPNNTLLISSALSQRFILSRLNLISDVINPFGIDSFIVSPL